jgi:hypothetical protein
MKINQLFNQTMSEEVLLQLMKCYGLNGLNDRRSFKKQDLVTIGTVNKINLLKDILDEYYLPCKSKLYLGDMTEKKAVTVLRQVLRLFEYHLVSKERNISNKKIIFYTLESDKDLENTTNIMTDQRKILYFN